MEKYSQYRDKATGIAPFLPIPNESSGLALPLHLFLLAVRVPLLVFVTFLYSVAFSWLSLGSLAKKCAIWVILGIPGVWWIDLQIDGVKRGSLAKAPQSRLPGSGSVIVSSHTSPIDILYLAAIFDPIFTASFPSTSQVQRISLFQAIIRALSMPLPEPPAKAQLTTLSQLVAKNPEASIVVFPECTTSNGRGILKFSPSLLTVPSKTKIFPVSLRYTPPDVTTPIPGTFLSFLWRLCSKPTHCIRVRIAEAVFNTNAAPQPSGSPVLSSRHPVAKSANSYETNFFDDLGLNQKSTGRDIVDSTSSDENGDESWSPSDRKLLDKIAEDLARLGRVKRTALGVEDKIGFLRLWLRRR